MLENCPILLTSTDHIEARGVAMFRRVCEMDLEGIVAKRRDGLYTPDETTWVKIRNPHYSQREGRHELFQKWLSAGVTDGYADEPSAASCFARCSLKHA